MFLQIDTDQIITQSNRWITSIQDMAILYVPKIVGAILVYIIGGWIIKKISHLLSLLLEKRKFDQSLTRFLLSLVKVSLNLMLFMAIAGMIGINITGFAALIAGAGVAIGAALNGSLGNLAGGVMLMIFKPFHVGDLIEAQGVSGVVTEIGIFSTTLLSAENKTIILPNGGLSTDKIINYNTHGNLRVDINVAIAPDQDIDKAREVALATMRAMPEILDTPAPDVSVLSISGGMTTLALRPYTTPAHYWTVFFGLQENVKKAFDSNNIAGPVPTSVVISKVAQA